MSDTFNVSGIFEEGVNMSAYPLQQLTPQDYLAFERRSETKHEFVNGEVFDMVGASRSHNLIIANVVGELRAQLKERRCEVYPNDMRVHIPRTGLYTYPDAVVVCGTPQFEDDRRDTLLNPTVIVEVLSPSTEAHDRGLKFESYRAIPSLQEYLLISQTKPLIERYVRQENTRFWMFDEAAGLDAVIELTAIACRLALAEVYDKIEFAPETNGGETA